MIDLPIEFLLQRRIKLAYDEIGCKSETQLQTIKAKAEEIEFLISLCEVKKVG